MIISSFLPLSLYYLSKDTHVYVVFDTVTLILQVYKVHKLSLAHHQSLINKRPEELVLVFDDRGRDGRPPQSLASNSWSPRGARFPLSQTAAPLLHPRLRVPDAPRASPTCTACFQACPFWAVRGIVCFPKHSLY